MSVRFDVTFSCGECGHLWENGGPCPCPTHPKPCPDRFPSGKVENVRLPWEPTEEEGP